MRYWIVKRDGWAKLLSIPGRNARLTMAEMPEVVPPAWSPAEPEPHILPVQERVFELRRWEEREHDFLRPGELYYAEI